MYDDDIEELNKWFNDNERHFDTGFNDEGEYSISTLDIDEFCNYLRDNHPDLIGIKCMVGTSGVWFTKEDLDKARYL